MRRSDRRRPRAVPQTLVAAGVIVVGMFVSSLVWPSLAARQVTGMTRLVTGRESKVIATPDHPLRVLLIGDSLAWEARQPFVSAVTYDKRATVDSVVYGGTALCDFLPGLPAELDRFKPQAVVLEFTGNQFTPCTRDLMGHPLSRSGLIARYGSDAAKAAVLFRDAGVVVYWADTPPSRWGDPMAAEVVDAAQRASAMVTPTTRIYAAKSVLNNGAYTDTLPCVTGEPCPPSGPQQQRVARVRSPDGEHFCPAAVATFGTIATCPTFSSGAWRYGRALAAPLVRHYRL